DWFKGKYSGWLGTVLNNRGPVYLAWVVISLLAFAMFAQSPKELAPTEDQGVIFGIVNTPANSTLQQVSYSTREINKVVMQTAETQFTFQITFPTGGFWGDGLKPWNERKRKAGEVVAEILGKVGEMRGVQALAVLPPALPGGGSFPVEFLIMPTAEPQDILQFAQRIQEQAAKSGIFAFPPQIDTKV